MSKNKFISAYSAKKFGANTFTPDMDTTDQRAPINNIEEMWHNFGLDDLVDAEVQDELDNENIDDFDNDVTPYEDISEFGEDILTASQPEIANAARRLSRKK